MSDKFNPPPARVAEPQPKPKWKPKTPLLRLLMSQETGIIPDANPMSSSSSSTPPVPVAGSSSRSVWDSKTPLLARLMTPKTGAPPETSTSPNTPSELTLPNASSSSPRVPRSTRRETYIHRGESWEETFERSDPAPPSEILPGLYLCNMKTAAAYLTGRVPPSPNLANPPRPRSIPWGQQWAELTGIATLTQKKSSRFPQISRMVTILPKDMSLSRYESMPEAVGADLQISHMHIEKLDYAGENLLEVFDEAVAFIHEGLQEFNESSARANDDVSDDPTEHRNTKPFEEISDRLTAISLHDKSLPGKDVSAILFYDWRSRRDTDTNTIGAEANTPTTEVERAFWSKSNTELTKLTATGSMSRPSDRSSSPASIARTPFDSTQIKPRHATPPPPSTNTNTNTTKPKLPIGGVLVHCHAGISRSSTIIAAYLLKHQRAHVTSSITQSLSNTATSEDEETPHESDSLIARTLNNDPVWQAIEYIYRRRPVICPNIGFRRQLRV